MLRSYMKQIQSLTIRREAENKALSEVNDRLYKRNRILWFSCIVTGLQWVFLTAMILAGYIDVTYNF